MTGNDVRNLLRERGHTQDTAADAIGVSRQAVTAWLRMGKVPRRAEIQLKQLPASTEDDADLRVLLPLIQRLIST